MIASGVVDEHLGAVVEAYRRAGLALPIVSPRASGGLSRLESGSPWPRVQRKLAEVANERATKRHVLAA